MAINSKLALDVLGFVMSWEIILNFLKIRVYEKKFSKPCVSQRLKILVIHKCGPLTWLPVKQAIMPHFSYFMPIPTDIQHLEKLKDTHFNIFMSTWD